jgi:hypothetical protein
MPPTPAPRPQHGTNDFVPGSSSRPDAEWVRPNGLQKPTFAVTCPYCKIKLGKYYASNIKTNGWLSTRDGMIIYDRMISFKCPKADCQKLFDAANQKVVPEVPETIAVEDNAVPAGASLAQPFLTIDGMTFTVLPDTNAPTVSNLVVRATQITDFTNLVTITSWTVDTRGFFWTDPETGQQVTKAFELRFAVKSNSYYTAWYTSSAALNNWKEYPTPKQLHPARGDYLSGISVPIWSSNVFVALRSFKGDTTTWPTL